MKFLFSWIFFLILIIPASGSCLEEPTAENFSQWSSASCKECHKKEFTQWEASTHHHSYHNELFSKNYSQERNPRCLDCHLPFRVQRKVALSKSENDLTREGITCTSCHTDHSSQPGHLQSPKLCARCHQFKFSRENVAAQNTYVEWQSFKAKSETKTCQQCHMQNGSHSFHTNSAELYYKKPLDIRYRIKNSSLFLSIRNVGAGHNLPTGDIFRHIEIQVEDNNRFKTVETIGRNPVWSTQQMKVTWKFNNSLKPGEKRDFLIPLGPTKHFRIVYYREASWAGPYYYFSPLNHFVILDKKL